MARSRSMSAIIDARKCCSTSKFISSTCRMREEENCARAGCACWGETPAARRRRALREAGGGGARGG
eukprot:3591391-Prymnesium_polylepis.2